MELKKAGPKWSAMFFRSFFPQNKESFPAKMWARLGNELKERLPKYENIFRLRKRNSSVFLQAMQKLVDVPFFKSLEGKKDSGWHSNRISNFLELFGFFYFCDPLLAKIQLFFSLSQKSALGFWKRCAWNIFACMSRQSKCFVSIIFYYFE